MAKTEGLFTEKAVSQILREDLPFTPNPFKGIMKPFRLFLVLLVLLVLLLLVLLSAAHCLPLIPHWPRLPSRKADLSWTGIMGTSACWNHLAAKNGF